jgi:pimeloyl-ACP methyl ester carboxylesterase
MKLELAHRELTIAYDEKGTGFPVVLLHAFPLDRAMWVPQLAPIAAAGYRVLAPDFPEFGESTPASDAFSIDRAADVVADFLEALEIDRAVVGGLSMGGYVAMAFARRHPARLAGLILVDTKAEPDDPAAREGRDTMISSVRANGPAAVGESMLAKLLSDQTRAAKPDAVALARKIATRQTESAMTAALYALRDRPDATPGLAAVTVPTLVVVGELDAVTPPRVAGKLADAIMGSEFRMISGAGHLSNIENPEAFNTAILAFLEHVK